MDDKTKNTNEKCIKELRVILEEIIMLLKLRTEDFKNLLKISGKFSDK